MKNIITIDYCLKMYQVGMNTIIENGEIIGFKEEIS